MLFIKLYLKICSKANGSITHSAKVTVVHSLQIQHGLFLVLVMGYTATTATSYVICIMDFLMNVYDGLSIVKNSKKGYPGRSNIMLNTLLVNFYFKNSDRSTCTTIFLFCFL